MIYTHVAAGLLGAAVAAGAAWKVQDWRYGEQLATWKADASNALVAQEASFRKTEQELNEAVAKAQVASAKRAAVARADAVAARSELDGLRDQLADLSRRGGTPQESAAACTQRAATVSELFGQCARDYLELAGKADRHANDVRTLIEAWPGADHAKTQTDPGLAQAGREPEKD